MVIGLLIAILVFMIITAVSAVIVAVCIVRFTMQTKGVRWPMVQHVFDVYNKAKKSGNNFYSGRI